MSRACNTPFGSPGYSAVIEKALDETFANFEADGIAITSVPCTAVTANVVNDKRNDRTRTATLNAVLQDYAGRHGISFVDLGPVNCRPDVSGLYVDGLHYSPDGSREVWDLLGPRIRELATGAPSMSS